MPTTGIAADPLKIVNIILPATAANNNNDKENESTTNSEENIRSSSSSSGGYVPPRADLNDEILFAEPSFSDKFFRYLVIVIYLGGLSSLGFLLSIYYIFFWDSRMPPVYKPTKKPPVFIKP